VKISSAYDNTAETRDHYTVWAIPDETTWWNESNPSSDDSAGATAVGTIGGCVVTNLAWSTSGTFADVQSDEAQACN
jgi:hypothetical protein